MQKTQTKKPQTKANKSKLKQQTQINPLPPKTKTNKTKQTHKKQPKQKPK